MFKNAIIYRINADWARPDGSDIEDALQGARFVPCGPTQRETSGWVEPRGERHGPLLENVGGELIFKLMVESRMLPSSVVKEKVELRCEQILAETGRKVGSKEKKELKEAVEHELLPQAFTKKGATLLWVSPKDRLLVVDAGSLGKADKVVTRFVEAMSIAGNTPTITPINTATSPSTAMAHWLVSQEPPYKFSVDRECELKSTDGEKATVRYSRHTLEIKEVVEHINVNGKVPTRLAMTHEGRVSFVLAADMSLKKVEVIDVSLLDSKKDESGFDADVAIVTGELRKLVPDLFEALGGEQVLGEAAEEGAGADAADTAVAGERLDALESGGDTQVTGDALETRLAELETAN